MARIATTQISESIEELKKIKQSVKRLKLEKRVTCLILLKSNRFGTQKETAKYLGISLKSIDRWLRIYREEGIKSLTAPMTRNKPSKIITPELHAGLEEKLQDAKDPLLGYWHARQWVLETFGIEVNYPWLRLYMKQNFKTKLKSPRKSHINKDDQAKEAFFKTT